MNKFVYFMAVGLAFTVLQVATVEADMIPGTDCAATPGGPEAVAACWDALHAAGGPMCGDVPCPTGDAEGMMEPPSCAGGEAPMCGGVACPTPAQIAAGDHGGMAPGTEPMCNDGPAMCGDAPCGPPPSMTPPA